MMATAQCDAPQAQQQSASSQADPELAGLGGDAMRQGKQTITLVESPYERAVRHTFQGFCDNDAPALSAWRREAFARFERLGMPTRRSEAWKAFNLRTLLNQAVQPAAKEVPASVVAAIDPAAYFPVAAADSLRLTFINGQYQPNLSSANLEAQGLHVESLADVLKGDEKSSQQTALFQQLSTALAQEDDVFVALNAALLESGVCIRVKEGVTVAAPVQILFLTTQSTQTEATPVATYLGNVVALESNAKLTLFVQHRSLQVDGAVSETAYINHSLNTVSLSQGASLDLTVLLDEAPPAFHLAATRAELAQDSSLNLTTVALGDSTSRHAINTQLLGERTSVTLNGLDVLRGRGTSHHHIVMGHQAPNAESDQFYKAVLDDAAQSSFNGLVFVAVGADGTDSKQLNKNLLLSDDARAWTRPQLQINADDVKCAHGATVGSLEPDQLFYLASRGFDRALAQSLLTFGFAEEVIDRVNHLDVRHYLARQALDTLQEAANPLRQELKGGSIV